MKSTEVFVEQLLIGVLGAVTLCLAFADWRHLVELTTAEATNAITSWVLGGVGLGVAYLLGVLMDRSADTLLDPLKRHQRLRFALSQARRPPSQWRPRYDPFDQARLEVVVRAHGGDLADWLHYLRSRIRIARGIAVYLPALTLSIVLATGGLQQTWLSWIIPLGYILAGLGNVLYPEIPKTHGDVKAIEAYYAARSGLRPKRALPPKEKRSSSQGAQLFTDVISCPVVRLGSAFIVVALLLARESQIGIQITLAGAALSLLAGWAWWRITQTLMRFLKKTENLQ